MYATSADSSTIPQSATLTTASPPEPLLKTFPPTGSAPSAASAKKTSPPLNSGLSGRKPFHPASLK